MEKRKDGIVLSGIVVLCALALVRSFFGFDWSDEAYVIAIVKRVIEGEKYFRDILDPHLFTSVIVYPFVYAYRMITGGYDGILLFMRLLLVIAQGGCAFLAWLFMKEKGRSTGYELCVVSLPFFVPAAVRTLSYNTLLFLCGYLLMVLLYGNRKGHAVQIMAGIVTAIAVFAYPSAVLVIPVLWLYFFRTERSWIFYIGSGLITGLVLGIFLLLHSSLTDVFSGLGTIMGNPEYEDLTFMSRLMTLFTQVIDLFRESIGLVLTSILAVLAILRVYVKKADRWFFPVLWEGILFALMVWMFISGRKVQYMFVPMICGNIFLYLLYGQKEQPDPYAFGVVIALAAAVYLMSDLGASACLPVGIPAAVLPR